MKRRKERKKGERQEEGRMGEEGKEKDSLRIKRSECLCHPRY